MELGEFALEYLRRLSSRFLVYTGVEGMQHEVAWISELQVRPSRHAHAEHAVGVTSKATDWASEVGDVLSFPR